MMSAYHEQLGIDVNNNESCRSITWNYFDKEKGDCEVL